MFAAKKIKGDVIKKPILIEGFGEVTHLHDIPAGTNARLQGKPHIIAKLDRLVENLLFGKLLLTALGALDGFLAIELLQLRDDLFLVPDFGLVIQILMPLLVTKLLLLFGIEGIIAVKNSGMRVLNLDDMIYGFVEEITVMRDNENSPLVVG